jgi:hypothetical protein
MEFLIHWVGWIIIFHAADYNRFKNGDSIIKPFSKDHWYQIVLILIAAILLKVEY